MPNIFVISDSHFGHANILNFTRGDGSKLRDFENVQEMDEHMVDRWNLVVRPQDKVYHLGDVTMSRKPVGLEIVKRLNGHKRLVLGNHDVMSCRDYLRYFEEVYASRVLDGMILTHIPIHPESMERFSANVHGHIHANAPFGEKYINVSMENVDYMPVALEDIKRNL